jgi:hypothetical protein
MSKRPTPHAKMKDLLGRIARVPKSEIDSEDACERADHAIMPRTKAKPGQIATMKKTGT